MRTVVLGHVNVETVAVGPKVLMMRQAVHVLGGERRRQVLALTLLTTTALMPMEARRRAYWVSRAREVWTDTQGPLATLDTARGHQAETT